MTTGERSTATVTFLFSDVEGSTALLRSLRDGYPAVIGDHERLLRAAWAESEGRELDADGDSFFVAFDRPRPASRSSARPRTAARRSWKRSASSRTSS